MYFTYIIRNYILAISSCAWVPNFVMCSQLAHLAVSNALGMLPQDSWSVMLFSVTVATRRTRTHILVYVSKTNYT